MARQPNYDLASMSSAVHAVAEAGSLELFSSVVLVGVEVYIMIRQLAPGMVEQMLSVCSDCNGGGEGINGKGHCRKCEGKTVIKEVKILEVHVDKGMKHGQRITFTGEADQVPGVDPGDVGLLLQEKEHEVFQRDGNDLHITYKIGLVEALCAFQFTFKHLDGPQIVVK